MATKKTAKKATKKPAATKKTKKNAAPDAPLGKCFVLMPFKDPFGSYFERIYKPAIAEAKLKPTRADDLFRSSMIISDIWNMIQEAEVLLAEVTTRNANVFYELGLAHAIGKPVVIVSETMDDVPFDLRPLRVLTYNKDDPEWGDSLRLDVARALQETLEDPIEAVPNTFRKTVKSQAPEQDETISRITALENSVAALRVKNQQPRSQPIGVVGAARRNLRDVSGPEDLRGWIVRWRKYLDPETMTQLIESAKKIPDDAIVADSLANLMNITEYD